MYPILIDFGTIEIFGRTVPLVVGGYGVMFSLSIIAGWLVVLRLGRRIDPDVGWTDLYFLPIIGGVIGAKLTVVVVFLPDILSGQASLLAVARGGGVWLGGVITGMAILYALARRNRLQPGAALDLFFVAIPLAHAIGRIGCLLAGCCHGTACDLPWAVIYTDPLAKTLSGAPLGVPLHPTVVYESLLELVNFGICITLWRRRPANGTIVSVWLVLYGVQRFFLEFLRADRRGGLGFLSTSQWIGLVTAIAGAAVLIRLYRSSSSPAPARAGRKRAGFR